jgi:hypothetical protein
MKLKTGWFKLYSNNWLHNINYIDKAGLFNVFFWSMCDLKPSKLNYNGIDYDVQELSLEPSDGNTIGKWECIIYGTIPKEVIKNESINCKYYS